MEQGVGALRRFEVVFPKAMIAASDLRIIGWSKLDCELVRLVESPRDGSRMVLPSSALAVLRLHSVKYESAVR